LVSSFASNSKSASLTFLSIVFIKSWFSLPAAKIGTAEDSFQLRSGTHEKLDECLAAANRIERRVLRLQKGPERNKLLQEFSSPLSTLLVLQREVADKERASLRRAWSQPVQGQVQLPFEKGLTPEELDKRENELHRIESGKTELIDLMQKLVAAGKENHDLMKTIERNVSEADLEFEAKEETNTKSKKKGNKQKKEKKSGRDPHISKFGKFKQALKKKFGRKGASTDKNSSTTDA